MQLTKHWAGQLDDYAIDLAWRPDGSQLAAASAAGSICIFASADGAKQHTLPGHENGTNCLAWQPVQTEPVDAQQAAVDTKNQSAPTGSRPAIPATLASG